MPGRTCTRCKKVIGIVRMIDVGSRHSKATCEHCGVKFISGVVIRCKTCNAILRGNQGIYPLDCPTCGAVQSHWLSSTQTATPSSPATVAAAPQSLRPATPSPAAPPQPPATSSATPAQSAPRRRSRGRRILLVGGFVVIVIAVVAALSGKSGPSADVVGKVTNVVLLDGNTVRIYMEWTNTGKAAGSAGCAMNTTVMNQFGDQVNIEVNSTNTNGSIEPGQTQNLYQDIGVNNGDAQYIKPSNVKITAC
jgi:hypothetical protein